MTFSPNTPHGNIVYGSYITLADAKVELQIPESDTSRDVALQRIIDAACQWVQLFCDRPFARTLYEPPYSVYDGGSGVNGTYITLGVAPIIEVVSVVEFQGSNPVALSEIQPETGGDGYRVDYRTGILTRVTGGVWPRPWMPSTEGVFVTFYAGCAEIPADIWFSTMELVRQWFRASQQQLAGRAPNPNDAAASQAPWPGVPGWLKGNLQGYVTPSVA